MSRMVATTIETIDGWTRMVYHGTCVAKYKQKSVTTGKEDQHGPFFKTVYDVVLNTGGYSTATTKKRTNQFSKMFDLNFRVYSKDGLLFVNLIKKDQVWTMGINVFEFDGNTCEFTVTK